MHRRQAREVWPIFRFVCYYINCIIILSIPLKYPERGFKWLKYSEARFDNLAIFVSSFCRRCLSSPILWRFVYIFYYKKYFSIFTGKREDRKIYTLASTQMIIASLLKNEKGLSVSIDTFRRGIREREKMVYIKMIKETALKSQ